MTSEFDDFAVFEFLVVNHPGFAVDEHGGVVNFVFVAEEVTCCTVNAHSEARDDFVENEECTVFLCENSCFLVEIEVDGTSAGFGSDRFYDDCRRAAAQFVLFEHCFEHTEIVGANFVGGLVATGDAVRFKELTASGNL